MSAVAGPGFDLAAYLAGERVTVEAALARVLDRTLPAAGRLEPAMRYAVEGGGKRLRPILCVAAYGACRPGEALPQAVYELGCAVELVHAYSLVHDDLPCMDDDDLRRGRATTHRAFGVDVAVLAGAALIGVAARAAAQSAADLGLAGAERMAVVRVLMSAAGAGGMVGGQWLDLEAEERAATLGGLEAIHERKTGALLRAAVRLGGMAAGADARRLAALDGYGRGIGLAFQIADDILDVTGEAQVLGKQTGKDAERAKATFPGVLGLEPARCRAREEAERAVDALRVAGLDTDALVALARYTVERDR